MGEQVRAAGSSLNKHFLCFVFFPLLKAFSTPHVIFILITGRGSIISFSFFFLGQADGAFVEEINDHATQH